MQADPCMMRRAHVRLISQGLSGFYHFFPVTLQLRNEAEGAGFSLGPGSFFLFLFFPACLRFRWAEVALDSCAVLLSLASSGGRAGSEPLDTPKKLAVTHGRPSPQ